MKVPYHAEREVGECPCQLWRNHAIERIPRPPMLQRERQARHGILAQCLQGVRAYRINTEWVEDGVTDGTAEAEHVHHSRVADEPVELSPGGIA